MHITRTGEGRWAVARRPASDPYRFVRDRRLIDLIDALDAALDVVIYDHKNLTPQQIEYLSGVLNEAIDYLVERRRVQNSQGALR